MSKLLSLLNKEASDKYNELSEAAKVLIDQTYQSYLRIEAPDHVTDPKKDQQYYMTSYNRMARVTSVNDTATKVNVRCQFGGLYKLQKSGNMWIVTGAKSVVVRLFESQDDAFSFDRHLKLFSRVQAMIAAIWSLENELKQS